MDVIAEEILDITDNTELGEIVTDGPKGVETKRADMLGHRTLKVDARKWLLSKLMPHRFGERVEHTGAGGGPVQVEHSLSAKMLDNLAALRLRLPAAPVAVAHVIDVTPSRGNAKA